MNLDHNFKHHPPSDPSVMVAHEEIREAAKALAVKITELCPESRERSLAITKTEEAMMWANAAIARNQS